MLYTFKQTPLTEFSTIYKLKSTINYKYNVSAPVIIYNTMFNFDRILLTKENEKRYKVSILFSTEENEFFSFSSVNKILSKLNIVL